MTPEDIVEDIPGSVTHPPVQSLSECVLPQNYEDVFEGRTPKTYAQAEARLAERIMDPEAPDDNSSRGVYLRFQFNAGPG